MVVAAQRAERTLRQGVVALVLSTAAGFAAAARSDRPDVRRMVLHMVAVIALTPLLDIVAAGACSGASGPSCRDGDDTVRPPDDHSVPEITSCMDLAGVIAVLTSMTLVGALPR